MEIVLDSVPEENLSIETDDECRPIALAGTKDFDLAILAQLNALLPDRIDERFVCIGDGGTMMVSWLTRENAARLGQYFGMSFGIP